MNHRRHRPVRGLRQFKILLKRADKRRLKLALCRVRQDERRAGYRLRYDPWEWD